MSDASKFKVSVWRPFLPTPALLMIPPSSSSDSDRSSATELTEDNALLQKEVYSWRMLEDAFGGITDSNERKRLQSLLIERMDVNVPPSQRTIESLRSFVNDARRALESNGAEWSGSQDPLTDDDEDRRVNPLLALVNHLSWLVDVFEDTPSTSVSVR